MSAYVEIAGSGKIRIPSLRRAKPLEREIPSEGTEVTLQPQISAFWSQLSGGGFSPSLIKFVWVAERCVQLNAQQIASMPLRFQRGAANSVEPAWLSNPDPVWYPNGIADAIFSAVDSFYRFGDAFLYMTDFYASGFPSAWTLLDALAVEVALDENGRREFRIRGELLDPARVVQISRNPRGQLRGTSALRSYAEMVNAQITTTVAGAEALQNNPTVVLKALRKITKEQARSVQDQWIDASSERRPGTPPIIPPDLELASTNLRFSPKDLMLVDSQEFNARVLASAFGVPPFALNLPLTGGLTYQNPQMMRDHWWFSELHPSAKRIANAFGAQMLPRGNAVWFDPSEWLAAAQGTTAFQPDPATVDASPAQQENVSQLRPVMEVTQ